MVPRACETKIMTTIPIGHRVAVPGACLRLQLSAPRDSSSSTYRVALQPGVGTSRGAMLPIVLVRARGREERAREHVRRRRRRRRRKRADERERSRGDETRRETGFQLLFFFFSGGRGRSLFPVTF